MTITSPEQFVSLERGELDRRIFSDPEIFDLEMELIFGRAWLFLCHESMIPKAGDFFEAPMGRDNVLVVRQKDGSIKALLNTCTHRGNAVCRAEEGNTKNFMCTYHGWTFALDGELIGVPGFENLYHSDLDKSALGLRQVAQIDSYKGFVFATMDASAPPLLDFLGATGRLGINLIAEQGDEMEVVPGIQKFVIDCNWKFAVDNLFDWYHPQITHMSAFAPGVSQIFNPPRDPARQAAMAAAVAAAASNPDARRHGIDQGGALKPDGSALEINAAGAGGGSIVIVGEYGHAISGPAVSPVFNQPWRERPQAISELGPIGIRVAGHPNIFPNSWVTLATQLSLRVPRTPTSTAIWFFSFVDKNASEAERQWLVQSHNHRFGPAGLLEQEDGENWAQSTMQTKGYISRRVPQKLAMNLGKGKLIHEHGFARYEGEITEHGQLWTYASWAQYMRGLGWDELRQATTPGDTL